MSDEVIYEVDTEEVDTQAPASASADVQEVEAQAPAEYEGGARSTHARELTDDERLALIDVIKKRIEPIDKDLKGEARASLLRAQQQDGTDRRAVLVGGVKVGEVGVSYAKGALHITDEAQALKALRAEGLTEEVPAKRWQEAYTVVSGRVINKETGEEANWAVYEPPYAKGASVRIKDEEEVLSAFGNRLAGINPLVLLEGGY